MKLIQLIFTAFLLLALYACQSDKGDSNRSQSESEDEQPPAERETPGKLIEYLIGDWELQNGGAERQRENVNERLTFTSEARYIAYSGNQKIDSGAYRMNEQLSNLYLESEADEQPREFELELKENVMTLTPKQSQAQGQQARGTSYTYKRVSGGTLQPNR